MRKTLDLAGIPDALDLALNMLFWPSAGENDDSYQRHIQVILADLDRPESKLSVFRDFLKGGVLDVVKVRNKFRYAVKQLSWDMTDDEVVIHFTNEIGNLVKGSDPRRIVTDFVKFQCSKEAENIGLKHQILGAMAKQCGVPKGDLGRLYGSIKKEQEREAARTADTRMRIFYSEDKEAETTDNITELLASLEDTYYVHRKQIVRVHKNGLKPLGETEMRYEISRNFQIVELTDFGPQLIKVPDAIVKAVLCQHSSFEFKQIDGVIDGAVLLPTGRLVYMPGYDEASKLYNLRREPIKGIERLLQPQTRDDAVRSTEFIMTTLYNEHPFKAAVDKVAAAASLLTAVNRQAIDHAPAFIGHAPKNQSRVGKTYQLNTACIVAFGEIPLPVTIDATREFDTEAKFEAAVTSGESVLFIDNIESELSSSFLTQILTSGKAQIREYRQNSKLIKVDVRLTTFMTLNGLVPFTIDILNRAIFIQYRPPVGVNRRTFSREELVQPHALAKKNRDDYILAALTVMKAYIDCGRPAAGGIPMVGFAQWCALVRDPLLWLAQDAKCDIAKTSDDFRGLNPTENRVAAMVEYIVRHFEAGSIITADDVVALSSRELAFATILHDLGVKDIAGNKAVIVDHKLTGVAGMPTAAGSIEIHPTTGGAMRYRISKQATSEAPVSNVVQLLRV